jgi:hypothetical protein
MDPALGWWVLQCMTATGPGLAVWQGNARQVAPDDEPMFVRERAGIADMDRVATRDGQYAAWPVMLERLTAL